MFFLTAGKRKSALQPANVQSAVRSWHETFREPHQPDHHGVELPEVRQPQRGNNVTSRCAVHEHQRRERTAGCDEVKPGAERYHQDAGGGGGRYVSLLASVLSGFAVYNRDRAIGTGDTVLFTADGYPQTPPRRRRDRRPRTYLKRGLKRSRVLDRSDVDLFAHLPRTTPDRPRTHPPVSLEP